MLKIRNIDYNADISKVIEILISRSDRDGIVEFHITNINPSACFNRELAEQFKKYLREQGYVDVFYDTGNSNRFKCKLNNDFLETMISNELLKMQEEKK